MRKVATIAATAVSLTILVAAPTGAQARFGAGAIGDAAASVPSAQAAQYYGGYRSYRPSYAPRYYGGYYDYRASGYKNSRDALATCAYC